MVTFSEEERRIIRLFPAGSQFRWGRESYTVRTCAKPSCSNGEPKTDIYLLLTSHANTLQEIKISLKKENADFLENKINAERAEQLLGADWSNIIKNSTLKIEKLFKIKPIIYKADMRKTQRGSITLGWKFELLNKLSGDLSGLLHLSRDQVIDVYSGCNLDEDKRHSFINGMRVQNSGVANYVLPTEYVTSAQNVLENLIPISTYAIQNPNIYFACKALNYRSLSGRWDGNRPLAVHLNWQVQKGILTPYYSFNQPLTTKGDKVVENLIESMHCVGVNNAMQLNQYNFAYPFLIYCNS